MESAQRLSLLDEKYAAKHLNMSPQEAIFTSYVPRSENYIIINEFLEDMSDTGLIKTDPRLKELYDGLNEITDTKLDKNKFIELITPNIELISKALRHDLVIPDFHEFASSVEDLYKKCIPNEEGTVYEAVPELSLMNPNNWGVAICTIHGQRCSFGNSTLGFTIQSCAKPLIYVLAHELLSTSVVHTYVGLEPSGRSTNALVLDESSRPHNPMINAGGIVISSLLQTLANPEQSSVKKFEGFLEFLKNLSGNEFIGFNNKVFISEKNTGDAIYALGFYLKQHKCLPEDADLEETLAFYFRAHSVETHCESLSVVAASLANGGVNPLTNVSALGNEAQRDVLSLMLSCGMNESSAMFAFKIGLPCTSGSSGAIMVVIPGIMGIACWCPRVNKHGISVRGQQFCEEFIKSYCVHQFEVCDSFSTKSNPLLIFHSNLKFHTVNYLLYAASGDLAGLVRYYLGGFNMSVRDYDERTALHVAAAGGHLDCVKFLVERCGLDKTTVDKWGSSPLAEAEEFGKLDVVAYLSKTMDPEQSISSKTGTVPSSSRKVSAVEAARPMCPIPEPKEGSQASVSAEGSRASGQSETVLMSPSEQMKVLAEVEKEFAVTDTGTELISEKSDKSEKSEVSEKSSKIEAGAEVEEVADVAEDAPDLRPTAYSEFDLIDEEPIPSSNRKLPGSFEADLKVPTTDGTSTPLKEGDDIEKELPSDIKPEEKVESSSAASREGDEVSVGIGSDTDDTYYTAMSNLSDMNQ